jgi:hypothetical protein
MYVGGKYMHFMTINTLLINLVYENAANKLSFLLVTHTTCFDVRFGHYGILKLGSSSEQILDRLGIQVLDQVFGPQDE